MNRLERERRREARYMKGSPFHVWTVISFVVGIVVAVYATWKAADSWTLWAAVGVFWMAFAAYNRGRIK